MNYSRLIRLRTLYQALSRLHQGHVISNISLTSTFFTMGQSTSSKNMSSQSGKSYEELRKKANNNPKDMSNSEWQDLLDIQAYYVTREKGTERPFSSWLNDEKDPGMTIKICTAFPVTFLSALRDYVSNIWGNL